VTITSGPGMALKTELMGLSVMGEIPLVLANVQRGGPSTGLPTKVEQGDLLAAVFGTPGDAPKIVMAPATIEDCFYSMITARKIAETFRTLVVVLSDANLATGQQLFDPLAGPADAWQGFWGQPDGAAAGDGDHILDGQTLAVEHNRVIHRSPPHGRVYPGLAIRQVPVLLPSNVNML